MRKILGLLMSLFLIFSTSADALALQVMYPHISKGGSSEVPRTISPNTSHETYAIRNATSTENPALTPSGRQYIEAKRLEEEMVYELELSQETGKSPEERKRELAQEIEIRKIRIANRREKIKKEKQLGKEARYGKKNETGYIFDPRNFMRGLLGERVGLGHTYLEQERPGLSRSYQESDGFRLVRMFDWIDGIDAIDMIGIAGRVELVEEPFPLEALILDAKKIEIIKTADYETKGVRKGMHWETRDQYRTQILPIYTKSTGIDAYFTYGNLPKFIFTYDYREIYHQYESLFGFKDWDIKTFDFRIEESRKWYPIGYVSIIPGYKYQIYDSEDAYSGAASSANEHRDWYYLDVLWAPSGTLEFYTKIDGFKTSYSDIDYKYSPWHWGLRGEVRKKYLPWRLSAVAGYAHSYDKYSPFENFLRKEEAYIDIGKDFTGRLKGSSRWEWIYAELTEDDNKAPTYDTFNPYQADAKVLNVKNKLQYEAFKNIFLTGGFDTATGFGFDEFNNFGLYSEIEYYNAGAFRCNFGYKYTYYYNLEDELNTIYFRCFLFM